MVRSARVWALLAAGWMAGAGVARSEILVMQGPDGRTLITNRGARSGYKVVSRHREFFGSSAMGMYAPVAGDPAKYEDTVRKTAKRYALEPSLVKAVIRAESNFDPMAISPKGAMGLMQLMPATARLYDVADPYDPASNIEAGIKHLKSLLQRLPVALALAAYNAGEAAVQRFNGIPPYPETRNYVSRILALANR